MTRPILTFAIVIGSALTTFARTVISTQLLSGKILEGQFKTKHYLEPLPATSAQQKQLLSALIGK